MAVLSYPGIYINEEQALGAVQNAGSTAAGFVGECEKGPIDVAGLVFSFTHFQRLYGSFYRNAILPISVKRFYDRCGEGNPLYISRVVGDSYASASRTLKDAKDTDDSLKIEAYSPGLY